MDYDPTRKSLYTPEWQDPLGFGPGWTRDQICAELSRLAYFRIEEPGGDPRLDPALTAAGFSAAKPFDAEKGAHAFGTVGPDGTRYVAFRGTQAGKWRDLRSDLDARTDLFSGDATAHHGFLAAYRTLEAAILPWLGDGAGRPLVATGHSLGAAMATILAAVRSEAELVTFGSPRVGNPAFAALFAGRSVRRYVDCTDAVTTVPLEGSRYTHLAGERYIDSTGVIAEAPSPDSVAEDRRAGRAEYLRQHAWKVWRNVLVRELADHAPINYVSALLGLRGND